MKKFIVFTDLDGTLLDAKTYSFEPALPAIKLLKEKEIPLIICSSKTRKEIEYYRRKLDNHDPFISENGGGIFIPKGYFQFPIQSSQFSVIDEDNYHVIRLGASYLELRRALLKLRAEGYNVKGFGDMTVEEVIKFTNLSIEEAEMAKERDFDEPFIFSGNEEELQRLFKSIKAMGFNYTQGRFFHILGNSDKGKAVSILIELYQRRFEEVITVAIGDSLNDIPMLERADYPVLVKKSDGTYEKLISINGLIRVDGTGSEGWNRAIFYLSNLLK